MGGNSMTNEFYKRLTGSFNSYEKKDFIAICGILDRELLSIDTDIAIISNDPYLLVMIFTSLIRFIGINIHIINPAESEDEIERLISVIKPHRIIMTDVTTDYFIRRPIRIDGDVVSRESSTEEIYEPPKDLYVEFTLITYSSYPTKVYKMEGDKFAVIVDSLVRDLYLYDRKLIRYKDVGLIPFVSNNPDYLLYFVALKMGYRKWGEDRTLPSKKEINLPLDHKFTYFKLNDYKTLFIPKKEFVEQWYKCITSMFEKKWVFKLYLRWRWFINLLIKRRLKRIFKGFKDVVIIGILDNSFMINMLKNLTFVNFYTIFPIRNAMMYGPISEDFESITPINNQWKLERFIPQKHMEKGCIYTLSMRLFDDGIDILLIDKNNKFSIKCGKGENPKYFLLGNAENTFSNKDVCIFPETLEKVINSYPFIKECALLVFNNEITLVINPNQDILDSNRINRGREVSIIWSLIDELNTELPNEYKIKDFTINSKLIEKNRLGEIIRHPFNRINNE